VCFYLTLVLEDSLDFLALARARDSRTRISALKGSTDFEPRGEIVPASLNTSAHLPIDRAYDVAG
jgi:hypothetical protein